MRVPIHIKGGVGRTMMSTNLAVRALENFNIVAVLDLDPNAGSRTWQAKRGKDEPPEALNGVSDVNDLPGAFEGLEQNGYDFVVVDGAPNTIETSAKVIEAVDIIVIPERCADDDVDSAAKISKLCSDLGTPCVVVINEVPVGKANPYQLETAQSIEASAAKAGIPTTRVYNRDAFLIARNAGVGVHELSGTKGNPKGAREDIDKLYGLVVVELLKKGKNNG
jgi:cellulose biosynthesis protein BcsQ